MFILDNTSGGIAKYRVQDPHVFLAENYGVDINFGDFQEMKNCTDQSIFIHFSSLQDANILNALKQFKQQGRKIVIDVDDYWEVPSNHYLYYFNKNNKTKEKFIEGIKLADLVTVSTEALRKELIKANKNVEILVNAIDYNYEKKWRVTKGSDERFTVGWAGGSSHYEDVKIINRIELFSKFENTQFILAGFDDRVRGVDGRINRNIEKNEWVKYEKTITNDYKFISDLAYRRYLLSYDKQLSFSNEVNQNYIRVWSKDVRTYLKALQNFDVALAPLVENKFNKYKSELKIIEASLHKIPVVATDTPMYEKIIKESHGGFTVSSKRSHKDFYKCLKILQTDYALRTDMGECLYDYCYNRFNLNQISNKRKQLYENL